jgi:hypothetical protein
MNKIYKYVAFDFSRPLKEDFVYLTLPAGAKVISIGMQGPCLCLWAVVNTGPERLKETRIFEIYGTGFEIKPHGRTFIGTVFDRNFVWHVFEREE